MTLDAPIMGQPDVLCSAQAPLEEPLSECLKKKKEKNEKERKSGK